MSGGSALGTDSRLSGEGDLLDELRAAHATRQVSARSLVFAVTAGAAAILRLPSAGRLEPRRPRGSHGCAASGGGSVRLAGPRTTDRRALDDD